MADKMRFVHQVAHLFRGQVLHALAQFGVLALLTHFGGKEQSGLYVLGLITTAPIFLFCELNLRVVRSTDQKYGESFISYVGLRAICLVLATVISLLIGYLFFPDKFLPIAALTAYRIGDSFSNLAFGGFQRVQQSDLIGRTLTIKGLISLAVVLVVAWLSGGSAVIVGFAMASIAIWFGLLRDLPLAWQNNEPETPVSLSLVRDAMLDFSTNARITKRALPLGFDASISSLALTIPQYFVEAIYGTAVLGVFGLLMKLAYSIQMLVGAVGHTGVSVLANHREENSRKQFWRLLNRMVATSLIVGGIAVIGGTLVLPKLLGYFFGTSYDQMWLIGILLVASSLTGAQRTAGRATQACNQYFAYASFDVIIFSTSLLASWLLVSQYGLIGAAASLAIAFGIGLVATMLHTKFLLWPGNGAANPTANGMMHPENTASSKST